MVLTEPRLRLVRQDRKNRDLRSIKSGLKTGLVTRNTSRRATVHSTFIIALTNSDDTVMLMPNKYNNN